MKSDLGAGDARDVKIADLAKRNREAGAQLAKEKAAVAQVRPCPFLTLLHYTFTHILSLGLC